MVDSFKDEIFLMMSIKDCMSRVVPHRNLDILLALQGWRIGDFIYRIKF